MKFAGVRVRKLSEYEIHQLIEQQNPEAKRRIWEKIKDKIGEESSIRDKEEGKL